MRPSDPFSRPISRYLSANIVDPIIVTARVQIPADAISWRAIRSGGPGGQNVNKVASKVELHIDLERIVGLEEDARVRLRRISASHRDADGQLLVTSQKTRSQSDNLEDAYEKVRALVLRAMVRPKARRPTKPSRGAREARLAEKHRTSDRKRQRRTRGDD